MKRDFTFIIFLLIAFWGLVGCKQSLERESRGLDFEEGYPRYNEYIERWLVEEKAKWELELEEVKESLTKVEEGKQARVQSKIAELERKVEKYEFRQSLGDYFAFKKPEDIPDGLEWENGMEEPEIGDSRAKKGGAFRYYIAAFPPTVRKFGTNGNNSFRGELYDNIEVGLVGFHRETGGLLPGTAKEWAVSEDGKTVYFRLDPEARFNDGVKIKPVDFMLSIYLRVSDYVVAPYAKQYFREQYAQIAIYGDGRTLSVTMPEAKALAPYYFDGMVPAPGHFYKDYGPDFEEFYNWQVPPTTAAYMVKEGDIKKGVSVTLTRVKDWWAKDKKFYKYRFNADRIVYTVIRDKPKAMELFRAGELDYFPISLPQDYYEKTEYEEVYGGYIERYKWYNDHPRIPWGLYINMAKEPLNSLDVRLGFAHAMDWQKVIDIVFRGDYSRLSSFTCGFGVYSNDEIKPRSYSVKKAREYFERAGYKMEGKGGVLVNEEGERLSISITYRSYPVYEAMLAILKEEAKKAGLEIILDGLEATAAYKKTIEKKHQVNFTAWSFQPPFPHYYEYFHSSNAYDDKGNLKGQTNNIFSYADDAMDSLCVAYRNARTQEELIENAHKIQEIVHEEGLFVPGFTSEFRRIACWRWVRWPDSAETSLAPAIIYSPNESYVYWIDEEMKRETLEAKRGGKTFPEVDAVIERVEKNVAGREEKEGGSDE